MAVCLGGLADVSGKWYSVPTVVYFGGDAQLSLRWWGKQVIVCVRARAALIPSIHCGAFQGSARGFSQLLRQKKTSPSPSDSESAHSTAL